MKCNNAVLLIREKSGDLYYKSEYKIAIRSNGVNNYVRHKNKDLAIMFLPFEENRRLIVKPYITDYYLANDNVLIRNVIED